MDESIIEFTSIFDGMNKIVMVRDAGDGFRLMDLSAGAPVPLTPEIFDSEGAIHKYLIETHGMPREGSALAVPDPTDLASVLEPGAIRSGSVETVGVSLGGLDLDAVGHMLALKNWFQFEVLAMYGIEFDDVLEDEDGLGFTIVNGKAVGRFRIEWKKDEN